MSSHSSHSLAVLALLVPLLCGAPGARAEKLGVSFESSLYADGKEKPLAMSTPEGVACTDQGQVVIADSGNGRLLNYKFKDGVFTYVAEVKYPQLGYPVRVQIDSAGNVLTLDQKTRRIPRTGAQGFAGYLEFDGVPGVVAFPVAFKLDKTDAVYVLDLAGRRVLVLDPAGKFVRAVPLPAEGLFTDLAVDDEGAIFVVDARHAQLWTAGKKDAAFVPLGKSLKGYMSFPTYLAPAGRGLFLLVDRHGNGLAVVGADGSFLGRRLSIGQQNGFLYYPGQLCISGGDAFVADRNNNRVQAFALAK